MQIITIRGTAFNLAHLVSFKYSPRTREKSRKGNGIDKGRTFGTGESESTSSLELTFVGTEVKPLSGEDADTKWVELAGLLTIDPTEFFGPVVHQPVRTE